MPTPRQIAPGAALPLALLLLGSCVRPSADEVLGALASDLQGAVHDPSIFTVELAPGAGPDLSEEEALAHAAWETMQSMPGESLTPVHMLLLRAGLFEAFADRFEGPVAILKLLDALTERLGTQESALAALFVGEEQVERAVRSLRRRRSSPPATLVKVAARLPRRYGAQIRAAAKALALSHSFSLAWPLAPETRLASRFGTRTHPVLGELRLHRGIDLSVPTGTPVRAAAAGVVRRARESRINGRMVVVDHGRGLRTFYLHNDALLVKPGERVERGEIIALSGNTGRTTGPHLHYQVELNGEVVDPMSLRRPKLEADGRRRGIPFVTRRPAALNDGRIGSPPRSWHAAL